MGAMRSVQGSSGIQSFFRGAKGDNGEIAMFGEAFDPNGEIVIYEHCRPHWSQAGAVVFITFRTNDSIPRAVIEQWEAEKQEWMRRHGKDNGKHWYLLAEELSERDRADFQKTFNRCREEFLDTCHGRRLLRRPELSQIVADSLLHFDGQRYRMGDFVVMPNHVHLLAVFPTAEAMKAQCDSWLHYTAARINSLIGESGKFWQQEPFDHLVRSPEQYEYLRKYIANNPHKASLRLGEYHYRRYPG
jgi:type I restriction enzyme R subunit